MVIVKLSVSLQDPQGPGPGNSFCAALDPQLAENISGMRLNSVQRQNQGLGDLLIALALSNQLKNIDLARAEVIQVRGRTLR